MLICGVHPEPYRRGAAHSRQLGEVFTGRILQARAHIHHRDPDAAAWAVFDMAFSTLVLRITYGPAFATPARGDRAFAETLAEMISRSLLR